MTLFLFTLTQKRKTANGNGSKTTIPNQPGKNAYKILDTLSTSPTKSAPHTALPTTTPQTASPKPPAVVDSDSDETVVGIEKDINELNMGQ